MFNGLRSILARKGESAIQVSMDEVEQIKCFDIKESNGIAVNDMTRSRTKVTSVGFE